jgi:hypothetical protein
MTNLSNQQHSNQQLTWKYFVCFEISGLGWTSLMLIELIGKDTLQYNQLVEVAQVTIAGRGRAIMSTHNFISPRLLIVVPSCNHTSSNVLGSSIIALDKRAKYFTSIQCIFLILQCTSSFASILSFSVTSVLTSLSYFNLFPIHSSNHIILTRKHF